VVTGRTIRHCQLFKVRASLFLFPTPTSGYAKVNLQFTTKLIPGLVFGLTLVTGVITGDRDLRCKDKEDSRFNI